MESPAAATTRSLSAEAISCCNAALCSAEKVDAMVGVDLVGALVGVLLLMLPWQPCSRLQLHWSEI